MESNINRQEAFIDSLVAYVEADPTWSALDKREGVAFAVRALTSDPGAAQDFLDACEYVGSTRKNRGTKEIEDPNQLILDL